MEKKPVLPVLDITCIGTRIPHQPDGSAPTTVPTAFLCRLTRMLHTPSCWGAWPTVVLAV